STTIERRFGLIGLSCSVQCDGGFTSDCASDVSASHGVLSKLTHMPCRSGWPSGVRVGVQAAALVADGCAPAPASANNPRNITAGLITRPLPRERIRPYARTLHRGDSARPTAPGAPRSARSRAASRASTLVVFSKLRHACARDRVTSFTGTCQNWVDTATKFRSSLLPD